MKKNKLVINLKNEKETFTWKVKNEVFQNKQYKYKCKIQQAYGILMFGRSFCEENISIITENKGVSRLYSNDIYDLVDILGTVTINEIKQRGGKSTFLVSVDDGEDRKKIISFFGHDSSTNRINYDFLKTDTEMHAFLSGVYLACGIITDPAKAYQMEFIVNDEKSALSLSDLLLMFKIKHGIMQRRNQYIVYIKDSEQIEDILNIIGAVQSAFEFMDVKIYKDIRNNVNRQTNCETANIDKTVKASAKQLSAIENLRDTMGLENLPADLRELAELRLNNPEMSLRELGENHSMKLSRSAVNYRMEKLLSMQHN